MLIILSLYTASFGGYWTVILNEKRKEWEEERLANLSKDEQISQLKKELFKANMKDQINNRLTEEGIPVKAAELIQYTDEAGTLKSLETVISF